MARRGWSTANFLRYSGAVVTAAPLTIAAWAKSSDVSSLQSVVGVFASGSAWNANSFILVLGNVTTPGAPNAWATAASQGIAKATAAPSANTWFHACAVFTSATSRAAYLNGGSKGTDATNITPASLNRTSVGVGDGSSASNPFAPAGTGDIAEVAMWNVALTDADVAVLARGVHPFLVRPDALVGYWPLMGAFSPEINLKSNTSVLSIQGTLSQSVHPRVFYPSHRRPFASVAGVITNQTIAATGAGSVALAKNVGKIAAITGSGAVAIAKSVGKKIAASGAGTVTLVKQVGKIVAVTGAGAVALARQIGKRVAAAGAGTVTMLRQVGKLIAATGIGTVVIGRASARTISIISTGAVTISKASLFYQTISVAAGYVVEIFAAANIVLRHARHHLGILPHVNLSTGAPHQRLGAIARGALGIIRNAGIPTGRGRGRPRR